MTTVAWVLLLLACSVLFSLWSKSAKDYQKLESENKALKARIDSMCKHRASFTDKLWELIDDDSDSDHCYDPDYSPSSANQAAEENY